MQSFRARIAKLLRDLPHPQSETLYGIVTGKTSLSSTGYPYISENSFSSFLRDVPHLFAHGNAVLSWVHGAEERLDAAWNFSDQELETIRRALRVIQNIVHSAAICAPPDLWVTKHILATHQTTGLTDFFLSGKSGDPETIANLLALNATHLTWDLSLLHTRGFLRLQTGKYSLGRSPQARDVYKNASGIPPEFLTDMAEPIAAALSEKKVGQATSELVKRFLFLPKCATRRLGWFATHEELEIGYRLLPLVLALHLLKIRKNVSAGTLLRDLLPRITPEANLLLQKAGMIRANTAVTPLAVRVLDRGPGPFGIIHAYVPYMRVLQEKLQGEATATWVQRGKNIAASQDANKKTFQMANDSLDRFCKDYGFEYNIFIEHALGLGEATRQRLERNGEERIRYFGADLEDAAIDRALVRQEQGMLPRKMKFVRRADIGKPEILINALKEQGVSTERSVMIVGNGFHEIRGQTNERVIDIFKGYCEAGILLIFTEESALSDHDLRATGWNTYHAGFRYVHELSGQGLRPASGTDRVGRHSWKICASLGGYAVLPRYSVHARTIYPYPRKGGYNPPISMTYFCIPAGLAISLGMYPSSWSAATKA